MHLNEQWVKETSRELESIETNEKENTRYQNLWDVAKAVTRDKFIAVNACIKKE